MLMSDVYILNLKKKMGCYNDRPQTQLEQPKLFEYSYYGTITDVRGRSTSIIAEYIYILIVCMHAAYSNRANPFALIERKSQDYRIPNEQNWKNVASWGLAGNPL
jgi:hypothetical protein